MALQVGSHFGHYDVTALIGEGGMGQVYQATDTHLGRDVALKILPDAFAADPDRLARFQREAQVLASLNHPGIAAIYGIEKSADAQALVLELVEGPTLADRIAQGPIPIDEALPIAKQIAEALEAAHEAGVIHRDLKPANIKVRDDGTVKVLDFGLAKALDTTPTGDPSQSPTLTAAAAQMGVIMGTAAYMSPEQAKGKVADRRSDVWAFGAVVYEMLAGRRAFVGDDVSDTLVSVFRDTPDWSALPDDAPPRVRRAVEVCLQKDPKQRVRDISAIRLAMEGAFETTVATPSETVVAQPSQFWQRPLPATVAALSLVVLTGLGVWSVTRATPPAPQPLGQFVLQTPPGETLQRASSDAEVAISPDGTHIVFTTGLGPPRSRQLYLRQLGELKATPLRGTDGGWAPFFSPDGQSVGFRDFRTLKRVSVLGGPAVTIAPLDGSSQGMSWGADDVIVFGSASGLMLVPASGGQPEPLTSVDTEQGETDHRFPHVLANLEGVLFTAWSGSDEESRLAVVSLKTGTVSYLLTGGSHPRSAPTGHIVYGVGGTLRAVGFDADRLELTSGNPVPVVEDLNTTPSGVANFALAANGSLVYVTGAELGAQRSLVWVDREGREEPLAMPPRPYRTPSISPDGLRVAVDVVHPEDSDIWIHDLVRGTETILTTGPAIDSGPLWALDGDRVVFSSNRDGQPALFQQDADTPGDAEPLGTTTGPFYIQPASWADEGQTLLFSQIDVDAQRTGPDGNIGRISMEADRGTELLLGAEFFEAAPDVSPDGGWIAYQSDDTGQSEVYVQRFPGLGDKMTISTDGGTHPLWSADGRELFYRAARAGRMMRVPVEAEPTFRAGTPELLFDTQYYFGNATPTYDLAPSGRFLMVKDPAPTDDAGASTQPQIVLVENWFEELERLVPIN